MTGLCCLTDQPTLVQATVAPMRASHVRACVCAGDGSPSTAASSPNHAAVSRLRALIANLREGAAFCKRLAASLKQVQVLLASSQAGVVHDAIVFLTMCK